MQGPFGDAPRLDLSPSTHGLSTYLYKLLRRKTHPNLPPISPPLNLDSPLKATKPTMNGSFFEGGIFPTWSLPPHIARNYVGPKPTARPTTSASASSSKTAASFDSQFPSSSHARSVRFPVAAEGRKSRRTGGQWMWKVPRDLHRTRGSDVVFFW